MIFRLISLLILLANCLYAGGQTKYMYYKDSVYLNTVDDLIAVYDDSSWSNSKSAGKVRRLGCWSVGSESSYMTFQASSSGTKKSNAFVSKVYLTPVGSELIVSPDIMIGFSPEVDYGRASVMISDAGLEIISGSMANDNVYHCRTDYDNSEQVLALANQIALSDEVVFCEPDFYFKGKANSFSGADISNCWPLHNDGSVRGVEDADMDVLQAWDITTGSEDIIVMVIDVGIKLDHEDLNVAYAKDFTSDGGSGGIFNPSYDKHGTTVAGCIAGQINGIGCAGVSPGCSVASARAMQGVDDEGHWYTSPSWTRSALQWAVEIGAKVTVNCNGYEFESSTINYAYQVTRSLGVIHFASAGNDGIGYLAYPGSHSSVNAVTASLSDNSFASFSNYGSGTSFSAPGIDIYTTTSNGGYGMFWGTSYSCPYAAGVAALVLSVDSNLSPDEIELILQNSAMDFGDPGYDNRFGYGGVNAWHAVSMAANRACRPADINRDHCVDLIDYSLWQCSYLSGVASDHADLDCSGSADIEDLEILSHLWLTSD